MRLEIGQLRRFLQVFKRRFSGSDPSAIVRETFEDVAVRIIDGTEANAFDTDQSAQQSLAAVLPAGRLPEAGIERAAGRCAGPAGRAPPDAAGAGRRRDGYESQLVGITAFEQLGQLPQSHQARCAALALLQGRRLGLARAAVIDVAFAALFHDLGRDEALAASRQRGAGEADSEVRRVSRASAAHVPRRRRAGQPPAPRRGEGSGHLRRPSRRRCPRGWWRFSARSTTHPSRPAHSGRGPGSRTAHPLRDGGTRYDRRCAPAARGHDRRSTRLARCSSSRMGISRWSRTLPGTPACLCPGHRRPGGLLDLADPAVRVRPVERVDAESGVSTSCTPS